MTPFEKPSHTAKQPATLDRTVLPFQSEGRVQSPRATKEQAQLSKYAKSFDLDRYAKLCAECARHANALDSARERFGLSKTDHTALDLHWRAQLTANPELHEFWRAN